MRTAGEQGPTDTATSDRDAHARALAAHTQRVLSRHPLYPEEQDCVPLKGNSRMPGPADPWAHPGIWLNVPQKAVGRGVGGRRAGSETLINGRSRLPAGARLTPMPAPS